MEGNMLYHQYLKPKSEYYGKHIDTSESNVYQINNIPATYSVISKIESVWKYYHVKGASLPDQGWKIHVTSTLDDSVEVLEKVAQLCISKKIEFKHLKDKQSFIQVNSKTANRASSGKFMTIYPTDNNAFIELLETIEAVTQDFKRGPYILSDKRWKNSNVFYRYGGFKVLLNDKGEHCIRDEEGNLIQDQRAPFYQVPSFVKDFDNYLNTINLSNDFKKESESRLEQYEIETALSYSNAGGVYLAIRRKDNLKVIIKEARPNAGLDGIFKDALSRQVAEYNALKTLENVQSVVDLVDYFQEWEHYFLVEEFIEGRDLRQWLSQEFPFLGDQESLKEYANKVKKILLQVFSLVEEMHKKDIAMGDLQPANIIVKENLSIKVIDFETSTPIASTEKPSMATIGFVSQEMKVSGARDWFGLKKLIRYLALPVLSSEDLDKYLKYNHLLWIKENYGESFYSFIINLQEKCDLKIRDYQEYSSPKIELNNHLSNFNVSDIILKLLKGLEKNLTNDERFINGDIRQFIAEEGKFNFLTGGSGAAFTLLKNNSRTTDVNKWINRFLITHFPQIKDNGLLSGKTGILALLYENGYIDTVRNELRVLQDNINKNDISLRSGISGIGLFIISLYLETDDAEYLKLAKELEELIEWNRQKKEPLQVKDWMAVDKGVIDGLSGVSLFYSALFSATKNEEYLDKAKTLIEEDLESTKTDEKNGLQILDERNRLLPYLSGGSIGLATSIWYLNHVSGKNFFSEQMNAILKLSSTRSTISGSLFDGAGSFLIIPSLVSNKEIQKKVLEEALNLLNIFLIQKDDYYVYPGQFSYRLSDDVYTGSSGIILALMGVEKNNPLYWLPLVNSDEFLAKTKAIINLKEISI